MTTKTDKKILTKKRYEFNYTVKEIEELLCRPEYATVPASDRTKLGKKEHAQVEKFENITSFGEELADLFEDLCDEFHRLPTQAEYIERGVDATRKWWDLAVKDRNPAVMGIGFYGVVVQACKDRLGRGYLSLVNEVHTAALLKDLFAGAKIITHDVLDLVLGVDIVMEYKGRRLYLHVYKNSYYGHKAFKNKQFRGGMYKDGHYIKYARDFKGDVSLIYDVIDTDTTEIINGIPLFTRSYLRWSINRALSARGTGESLLDDTSKLTKLNDWLSKNFNMYVNFYD